MTTQLSRLIKIGETVRTGFAMAALSVLVTSCASVPSTIVHDPVGPDVALKQKQNGFLTVFSTTAWMSDSDGPRLLTHTDYEVMSADSKLHETVRNGDSEPARVLLPEGKYIVDAQSDTAGTVTVPVVIRAGRTTIVHLEREKDWKEASASRRTLVRLPNGQAIGVRARPEMPAKS